MSQYRVSYADARQEIVAEVVKRKTSYPKMLQSGKIKDKKEAERHIALMEYVASILIAYEGEHAAIKAKPDPAGVPHKDFLPQDTFFQDQIITVEL